MVLAAPEANEPQSYKLTLPDLNGVKSFLAGEVRKLALVDSGCTKKKVRKMAMLTLIMKRRVEVRVSSWFGTVRWI